VRCEIVLLAEQNLEPAASRIPRDTGAVDSPTHDDNVECVWFGAVCRCHGSLSKHISSQKSRNEGGGS
jgi:hypothetical protein